MKTKSVAPQEILGDIHNIACVYVDDMETAEADEFTVHCRRESCEELARWDGVAFRDLSERTLELLCDIMEDMDGADYWTRAHKTFKHRVMLLAGMLEPYRPDSFEAGRSGRMVEVKPYAIIDGKKYQLNSNRNTKHPVT